MNVSSPYFFLIIFEHISNQFYSVNIVPAGSDIIGILSKFLKGTTAGASNIFNSAIPNLRAIHPRLR